MYTHKGTVKSTLLHGRQPASRQNPPVASYRTAAFSGSRNTSLAMPVPGYRRTPHMYPRNRVMPVKGEWFQNLPEEEKRAIFHLERDTDQASGQLRENGELHAFSAYVGGSFENFNGYLRAIYGLTERGAEQKLSGIKRYRGGSGPQNRENDEKAIANMVSAYRGHAPAIEHEITVYRGSGAFLLGKEEQANLLSNGCTAESLIGKTIVEPAFLSTSVQKSHAEGFAKAVLLTIKVPAGKRAFYVTQNIEGRSGFKMGKLRNENEVIFPPGQELVIRSVEISEKDGYPFYAIEAGMAEGNDMVVPPVIEKRLEERAQEKPAKRRGTRPGVKRLPSGLPGAPIVRPKLKRNS